MDNTFFLKQKDHDVALLIINNEGEIQGCRIRNSARVPFKATDNIKNIG